MGVFKRDDFDGPVERRVTRERWRQLERGQRRVLLEAIQKGVELSDPENRSLAVQLSRQWQAQYRVAMLIVPVVGAIITFFVRLSTGEPVLRALVVTVGGWLLFSTLLVAVLRRKLRGLRRTEELNQAGEEGRGHALF